MMNKNSRFLMVITNLSHVILKPSFVILNGVKDLRAGSAKDRMVEELKNQILRPFGPQNDRLKYGANLWNIELQGLFN